MRTPVVFCLLLAAAAGSANAQQSVDRLTWLAGCWELRAGARVTLEMWMPPAGGLMIGGSRTVVGGAAREFEHLRIREVNGRLQYEAVPSGQAPATFPATLVSDTLLVFENPQHDFPQRILYRPAGADSLIARIEGPGRNGPRGISFPMRRASCTS